MRLAWNDCLVFLRQIFIIFLSFLYACEGKKPTIAYPSYFPVESKSYFDSVRGETIFLGKKLFFDKRLSRDNQISCASCHLPHLAFTDGKRISQGYRGRFSKHNSSTLLNVGFLKSFMFDKGSHNLEIQPIIPLLDTNEMNMTLLDLEEKFKKDHVYQSLSLKTYGRGLDRFAITRALAAYMKSLIACDARYDSFISTRDSTILSAYEKKGMQLFFGRGKCNQCHTAPLFTDSEHYNLGLENPKMGKLGVFANTLKPEDIGRFKTPTLRNIAITAPYFHDGRIDRLEDAVHYHQTPDRMTHDFTPVKLSNEEIRCISAFLFTLTDRRYLSSR